MAQLSLPDMKGAIAYALSWPERLPLEHPLPDFAELGALRFESPDMDKFSCLALAFDACRAGGSMPAVLNAANEVAVEAFLDGDIGFDRIWPVFRRRSGLARELPGQPQNCCSRASPLLRGCALPVRVRFRIFAGKPAPTWSSAPGA